jgi:serine protease Do
MPADAGRRQPGEAREAFGAAARPPPAAVATAARAVVRIVAPRSGSNAGARDGGHVGLGVVVDPRGYVLTQARLVAARGARDVVLPDGRRLPVRQIWTDRLSDLAVLRVDGDGLPALTLGESGGLRVGDRAITLRSPGEPGAASLATLRATGSATGGNLVLDAALPPEHAGAPLLDLQARVVGIVAAGPDTGGPAPAGGVAVPIDRVRPLLERARSGDPAGRRGVTRPSR